MELFDSSYCQSLRKKIDDTDSIKERHILINKYLSQRISCIEKVLANEFPDDVCLEDMIECLWQDLILANNQIKITYGNVVGNFKTKKANK